jgi:hypothetical protein
MELPNDFDTFLQEIRPTTSMRSDCRIGHKVLRQRLHQDKELQPILVSDFLQGSYRRSTAVRPKNGERSDVDIIVVTKLSEAEYSPQKAMDLFVPFLNRHYKDKWKPQGRSFGIELSYVDLDLVITSSPSESEFGILGSDAVTTDEDIAEAKDWRLNQSWISLEKREHNADAKILIEMAKRQPERKSKPLRISDRNVNMWEDTHPLEQIRVTCNKNQVTNGHFVNVVKCVKWWWLERFEDPKQPKGFPLERIIGDCCEEGISYIAEGLVTTFENIVTKYGVDVDSKSKPRLPDYGVLTHDVLKRVTAEEFRIFYEQAKKAASIARRAIESSDRVESGELWRELLGGKFPPPPPSNGSKNSGYTPPSDPARPGFGRFA